MEKIDVAPTKCKVNDVIAHSTDKADFIPSLTEHMIDVVLRSSYEGPLYGGTFIDHYTMTVLNDVSVGLRVFGFAIIERFIIPENAPIDTPDVSTTMGVPPIEATPDDSGSNIQSQTGEVQDTQTLDGLQQSTGGQSDPPVLNLVS